MAHDGDILSIKIFSASDRNEYRASDRVTKQVNDWLSNYPADLVHSIQPQVTEFTDTGGDYPVGLTRYTVTVVVRS